MAVMNESDDNHDDADDNTTVTLLDVKYYRDGTFIVMSLIKEESMCH